MDVDGRVLGRRSFLGIMPLGIMALCMAPVRPAVGQVQCEPFIRNLVKAFDNQGRLWNASHLSKQDIDDLQYAFWEIRPATHQELVLVAAIEGFWDCTITNVRRKLADEYVRRKAGRPARYPDHPLLHLTRMGVPDTRGLMVFREQYIALLMELMNLSSATCADVLSKIETGRLFWGCQEIESLVKTRHPELSMEEVDDIFDACEAWLRLTGVKYYLYSTIVTRAMAMSA